MNHGEARKTLLSEPRQDSYSSFKQKVSFDQGDHNICLSNQDVSESEMGSYQ